MHENRGPRRRAPASGHEFRVLSFNIERLSDLTDPDDEMGMRGSRMVYDLELRSQLTSQLILASDADIVAVQEGPPDPRMMRRWTDAHLGPGWSIVGGSRNDRRLEQYVLTRPNGFVRNLELLDGERERRYLRDPWQAFVSPLEEPQTLTWSRSPLPTRMTVGSHTVTVINIHFGSKGIYKGAELARRDPQAYLAKALAIRLQLRAEALRVHAYVRELLAQDPTAAIIVAGDFNDGPTKGHVSRRLSFSWAVAPLFGSPVQDATMLRSTLGLSLPADVHFERDPRHPHAPWSLEFLDEVFGNTWVRAWIDLIGVSRSITVLDSRIEHELYEQFTARDGRLVVRPSDHVPTSADLWVPAA